MLCLWGDGGVPKPKGHTIVRWNAQKKKLGFDQGNILMLALYDFLGRNSDMAAILNWNLMMQNEWFSQIIVKKSLCLKTKPCTITREDFCDSFVCWWIWLIDVTIWSSQEASPFPVSLLSFDPRGGIKFTWSHTYKILEKDYPSFFSDILIEIPMLAY